MIEVLLLIGTASLLVFGAATLFVATLALRTARRYVELAEERMECLRKGQARLLGLPTDEQQRLSEKLERERRVRGDAERRMERLEREVREARRAGPLPAVVGPSKGRRETYGLAGKDALPNRNVREGERVPPTSFLETSTRKLSDGPPKDGKPRLAVKHPHPDDAIVGAQPSPERARPLSAAPVEMFRKHYDKYLENYRGYVELAEHLHRTRDDGERIPGSFEENHWEERLRRVNDGITRTIARLDILEGQNPELAADDLVSRRTRVAHRHSELGGTGDAARET